MAKRRPSGLPGEDYARAVAAEAINAGKLIRQASARFLSDLERWGTQPSKSRYHFDASRALHAISFIERFCCHSLGEWAGAPLLLEPWQRFVVANLFGWIDHTGARRFRRAYISVARKNGKSTLAAAISLYLMLGDGEPGAHVFAAATKKEQALLVFGEAERMVRQSPSLRGRLANPKNNLNDPRTSSKFEPLASDYKTLDGLNPHGANVDELHAHSSPMVYDLLSTAVGSRRQPLVFATTTAGYDRHSVCYREYSYCSSILNGTTTDDTYFAAIWELDDEASWIDEANWPQANPNLGVSVNLDDLRTQVEKARSLPSEESVVRRLRLNQWTESAARWLPLDAWDACVDPDGRTLEDFRGRVCFAGIDLASRVDIAALALAFPPIDGEMGVSLFCRYWIPAENVSARVKRDGAPYDAWVRDRRVKATEGTIIDHDVIRADILDLLSVVQIDEIAADRFNAHQLIADLMSDGFTVFEHGQGFVSMAGPTRDFETAVLSGRLSHEDDPVLRWMIANTAVQLDAAGNPKPAKHRSTGRIDGVVASIMGFGRAVTHQLPASTISVYEERGIEWLS